MKQDIHPTFYPDAKVICACGAVIVAGSTLKEQKTDICSKCHPFYTGKQKLIDSAGRVDRFKAKMEAAQNIADSSKDNGKKANKKDDKYMTIEDIKSLKETGSKKGGKTTTSPAEKEKAKEPKKAKAPAKKTAAKKPAAKKTATKKAA